MLDRVWVIGVCRAVVQWFLLVVVVVGVGVVELDQAKVQQAV